MSSSRRGGTKLQNCVIAAVASNENHSSNGHGEVIRARCYCDQAFLAAIERSNEHRDRISPLLLWPSSAHT
jgi:hypothetical protein